MPTYEYRCQDCGHQFDQFQRMSDDPLRECPVCQGVIKRLIGKGAGLIFKGSGFYQTDYRSQNYQREAAKESGATSTATPPAAASTPAAAPASAPAPSATKKESASKAS